MGVGVKALSVLGLIISVYALWVEINVHRHSGYKALCDLHQYVSCSKVLTSKYSKGFGVLAEILGEDHPLNLPNCVYGIFYYLIYLFLDTVRQSKIVVKMKFSMSMSSLLMCLYLGYILAFILRDLCLVCFATYLVNIALAVPAIIDYLNVPESERGLKKE